MTASTDAVGPARLHAQHDLANKVARARAELEQAEPMLAMVEVDSVELRYDLAQAKSLAARIERRLRGQPDVAA